MKYSKKMLPVTVFIVRRGKVTVLETWTKRNRDDSRYSGKLGKTWDYIAIASRMADGYLRIVQTIFHGKKAVIH